MYRVFVLILIGSLVLPAVPVSGCECSQQRSGQTNGCCCSKAASQQSQKQKPCCCQASQKSEKSNTPKQKQIQCQKQNCHCHQTYLQPATTTPVKSIELAQQLRDNFESVDLTREPGFSAPPASAKTFELPHPVHANDSGEFCAQFCLWLI